MTQMLRAILEEGRWDWLVRRHPCLFAAMLFVGMPLGVLLAVSLFTIAVSLPLAFLLGWL